MCVTEFCCFSQQRHGLLSICTGSSFTTPWCQSRIDGGSSCPIAYVKERGSDDVKADDIVRAIKPRGRQRVPDHVKAELLTQLRKFIITGS